ncbi:MAG: hypothetical protein V7603_5046 [Micromonosporaceae bacterium]
MKRVPTVLVTWTFTEQHQALIPAAELADALGVDPSAFTASALTEREHTDTLDNLLAKYQDAEYQDPASYQNCVGREITDAEPGREVTDTEVTDTEPAPSLAELLRQADDLLGGEHATTGLSDAGILLEQIVAAIRAHGGGAA